MSRKARGGRGRGRRPGRSRRDVPDPRRGGGETRRGPAGARVLPALSVLSVLAVAFAVPATAQEGEEGTVQCQVCHGNFGFMQGQRETPARDSALLVTDELVEPSVHGPLPCIACHPGYGEGYPHDVDRTARPCGDCHASAGRAWAGSVHAANVAERGDAASCVDCHGSHRVFPPDDRRSSVHALNVAETCARCHADPEIVGEYFATPDEATARHAVSRYFETVHGTALTESGLVVSATCDDCHRSHDILPADSAGSSVHRSHISETCGACHLGILEVFEASAHGAALREEGSARAPVCTDCHTSHQIVETDEPAWFLGVVEECGTCHEELYDRYFDTYHGKVTRLGSGLAAQCSECHTAHAMLPASDPGSSVHPANLVETCARCHEGANENFVQYYAHGDHTDRERYPKLFWPWLFMTALLAGVFGFFGTHTLLWLTRVGIERARGGGAGGERSAEGGLAHGPEGEGEGR